MPITSPVRNRVAPRLLLVDDDVPTRAFIAASLTRAGYEVIQADDGTRGLALAEQEKPALILLDVDMPKPNGWQTLEQLRNSGFSRPILMLTGRTLVDDRVKGLSGGADDYLCKPCDMRELIARVDTALRRTLPKKSGVKLLQFGPTQVDLEARTALRDGHPVKLTRTEYAMLDFFARHAGELVTREMMLESVWGYAKAPNTRTVDTHVWRLRKKLNEDPEAPRWIQSVSAGSGYRMICEKPAA